MATLLKTQEDGLFVEGVVVRMTAEEVARLDPFEGFPTWYNRVPIELTLTDNSKISG